MTQTTDFEISPPGLTDQELLDAGTVIPKIDDAGIEPEPKSWEIEKDSELSLFDRLREKVEQEIVRPDIILEVPERQGVKVRYKVELPVRQLLAWRKDAGGDSRKGLDVLKFSSHVCAAMCTGIMIDEEVVVDKNGDEMVFQSPDLLKWLGVSNAWPDAVCALYGVDPHVQAAADAILVAAGYGAEVSPEEDPTQKP